MAELAHMQVNELLNSERTKKPEKVIESEKGSDVFTDA